jgi:hypothetical protein
MTTPRQLGGDAIAAGLLAIVTIALYRGVLGFWWMNDDAYHLNVIAVTPAMHFLTSAAFWHSFVAPVFTPLLLLSLAADAALWGHAPHAFYVHQLLAAAAIAPLLYVLLRMWVPRPIAFLASLTAIAGAPFMQIVALLMLRHYVEGLLLAILAAIAQTVAVRREAAGLSVISAALGLSAMIAKEVFVPIPLLFLAIPRGLHRRYLAPQAVALAIYSVWRMALLGPALRGYGWTVRPSEWPRVVATLPFRAFRILTLSNPAGYLGVALLLVTMLIVIVKLPSSRLRIALGFVVALVPVIPVSIDVEPRYALGVWLLLVISAAFVTCALPRMALPLICVIALSALAANRMGWYQQLIRLRRMSIEGRAYAGLLAGDVLRNPTIPPASLGELQKLTSTPATGSYDDILLCEHTVVPRRLFEYDERRRAVCQISTDAAACGHIRVMPLNAAFTLTGGDSFYWRLGPRLDGRYRFILGTQAFDVPSDGGFRLPTLRRLGLRIAYVAPEGWATYSPGIALDLDQRTEVRWSR